MNNFGRTISPIITAVTAGLIAAGFVAISLWGPDRPKAEANYSMPLPPPTIQPPFNNPISNPLDVTPVPPMKGGDLPPDIGNLTFGGPATDGISVPKSFPSQEYLKGNSDYILVQPEANANITRQSPFLVTLNEGTVLAGVKRPSNMGMIQTPIGEVAFSANSDAFITFSNGALRVRNVDGLGQTLKIRITSGPLAGKLFSVAPGYELVVADHKLTKADLRPGDGILRRGSQTFENGFAGVSQYHVHSALTQSGVVGHLTAKEASDTMARKVIGDMSRMAAVLNHVQGSTGFSN